MLKALFVTSHVWWRYEFAKSRGAIHFHAILWGVDRYLRDDMPTEEGAPAGEYGRALAIAIGDSYFFL